jgi:hypothetical protein
MRQADCKMMILEIYQRVFLARVVAVIAALGFCALLAGCAANLEPAPQAQTVGDNEPAAFSEVAGIRVMVVPNQWSGSPADLSDHVTLFQLEIENGSDQPLRIRYREFKLVGPRSFTTTAIPPYKVEGTVVKPVFLPQTYVYPHGFELAPHYRTRIEDTSRPRHPWDYDDYTPRYNLWASPLPTEDMLAKGLTEGVLEPDGRISGFLYFEKLPENLDRVTFEADLVNARTGVKFGTVRIPFLVK